MPAVEVGEASEFAPGLTMTLTEVGEADVGAIGPGETAGPAVVAHLEVTNDTAEPVDLNGLAVTAVRPDGTPVGPSRGSPADALEGVLQPGASGEGTYVFRVDGDQDGLVVVASHSDHQSVLSFDT